MNLKINNFPLSKMSSTETINSFILHEPDQPETKNLRFSISCELNSALTISAINYFGQVVEVDVQEPGGGPTSGTGIGFGLLTPPVPVEVDPFAIATPTMLPRPNTTAITPRVTNFLMSSLLGQDK